MSRISCLALTLLAAALQISQEKPRHSCWFENRVCIMYRSLPLTRTYGDIDRDPSEIHTLIASISNLKDYL